LQQGRFAGVSEKPTIRITIDLRDVAARAQNRRVRLMHALAQFQSFFLFPQQ
jgi:hypothetical protein